MGCRSPKEMGQLWGLSDLLKTLKDVAAVYAKITEMIEMSFGG